MPRTPSARKFQLTINNPLEHGMSHEAMKEQLATLSSIIYWCMCDEIGEQGTPHTHIYIASKNPVMFTTLKKRFPSAHIEAARGSHQENLDYIQKQGKWADDEKSETNLLDTFEEWGELPSDRQQRADNDAVILEMIKDGKTNIEIIDAFPSVMYKLEKLERMRQEYLKNENRNEFRILHVIYIWGKSRVGKTRSVMEKYGYENVYRVTNYNHPFDGYNGEEVILFDEFRSSLPLADMLKYLDGYPVYLPARYSDKIALFTIVYIISNIPLERQYAYEHANEPLSWNAFKRRINEVYEMTENGKLVYPDIPF